MGKNKITIRGAREHNLKDINVEIPKEKLVVITGLSVQVKVRSPLILYMLKANVAMLRVCQRMLGNF